MTIFVADAKPSVVVCAPENSGSLLKTETPAHPLRRTGWTQISSHRKTGKLLQENLRDVAPLIRCNRRNRKAVASLQDQHLRQLRVSAQFSQ